MYKTDDFPFVQRYAVIGSRRASNLFWGGSLLLGSFGFLTTGVSSYLHRNLLFFIDAQNILFFPQGLVMCFYGVLGLFFSWYLFFLAWWDVGGGFNEFNLEDGFVHIFRWGFPGKNRRVDLIYTVNSVQSIRIELKNGIGTRRAIYMRVEQNKPIKDQKDVPLTSISTPLTMEEIETQAYQLASFLKVPLEM